jgi:hypothetical protein
MGKALLIIVLGAGLVMARHLYTSLETQQATTRDQVSFQEETVAREIARSAFNNAMGVIRSHGENVDAGVTAAGGVAGQRGEVLGGEYRVRAEAISGHSVRVTATGYFGGSFNEEGQYEGGTVYTMHDTYRVPVMINREWSTMEFSNFDTGGSDCTALYYQEVYPDRPQSEQPSPRLLVAADNNENLAARLRTNLVVAPNTQMNFIVGVDADCSERPVIPPTDTCTWREYLANHEFNPSDYDRVRPALLVDPLAMQRTEENAWAMVEQHPSNRQRWRIGFETASQAWDNPDSNTPGNSLQATKRRGYGGTGWSHGADGFRSLQNSGSAPDFNDLVVDVTMSRLDGAAAVAEERARIAAENAACSITPPVESGEETTEPPVSGTPTSAPPTTCQCPGHQPAFKVAIMHRPPGNEENEHIICVAPSGATTHLRQHNDYVVCTGP